MSGSRNAIDFNQAYDQVSKAAVLTPTVGQQLNIYYAKLQNQSAATINLGLLLKLYQLDPNLLFATVPAAGPLADQTATINGGSAVSIFTLNNNDGFLVQAKK